MAGKTALVTVRGNQSRVDLQMPLEVPIEELIPSLLEALAMATGNRTLDTAQVWGLGRPGGNAPLVTAHSLQQAGVLDGETLIVQDMAAWKQQRVTKPTPAAPPPSDISVKWHAVEGWSKKQ